MYTDNQCQVGRVGAQKSTPDIKIKINLINSNTEDNSIHSTVHLTIKVTPAVHNYIFNSLEQGIKNKFLDSSAVLRTAQTALHFTSLADMFNQTQSQLL